jgi:hypothetical protein
VTMFPLHQVDTLSIGAIAFLPLFRTPIVIVPSVFQLCDFTPEI